MAHIDRNIMTEPHGHIDAALRPEIDSDAREIALWLRSLLHRIHREVHLSYLAGWFYDLYAIFTSELPRQCSRIQPTPTTMDILGCSE